MRKLLVARGKYRLDFTGNWQLATNNFLTSSAIHLVHDRIRDQVGAYEVEFAEADFRVGAGGGGFALRNGDGAGLAGRGGGECRQ